MPGVIVVGTQWGDEGKGKIIDLLTPHAQHIVRAQGGNNAGHTILIGKEEYKLHLIPSGILHTHTQCYLGGGVVIDPEVLLKEIQTLESRGADLKGRLWISPYAHVIFPYHKVLDVLMEKRKGTLSLGTTGKGIGPCYADRASRLGIRMGEMIRPDLFSKILRHALSIKNEEISKIFEGDPWSFEKVYEPYSRYAELLAPYVADVEGKLATGLEKGENFLLEGAQGTFLDNIYGTYPYVTSSITTAAGICSGAGMGLRSISHTLGVVKAYTTRVGQGPFPTELKDNEVFLDHQEAREFGTTTGRKRRIGWFDAMLCKMAVRINGLDSLAITKLDILDGLKEIPICIGYRLEGKELKSFPALAEECAKVEPVYEVMPGWQCPTRNIKQYADLPSQAKQYLKKIEALCNTPISMVSVGPERESTIMIRQPFEST